MKQYNYVVTIKQPDYKLINAISQFMLLFAVTVFIYTASFIYTALQNKNMFIFNCVISALIALGWFYSFILSKKENYVVYYRLALFFAAVGWFFQPEKNIFFSVLYLLASILEKQIKFPQEIGVDEEGITFNSFPKNFLTWSEINNMMIKDGIITVDYKNNKLFQKEVESKVSASLEKELNEFCREKLMVNR